MRVSKIMKMNEKLFLDLFLLKQFREIARSLSTKIAAATRFLSCIHNLWTLISRR